MYGTMRLMQEIMTRGGSLALCLLVVATFGVLHVFSLSLADAFAVGPDHAFTTNDPDNGLFFHHNATIAHGKQAAPAGQGGIGHDARPDGEGLPFDAGESTRRDVFFVMDRPPNGHEEAHDPAFHQSSSQEEALVWKSPTHCNHVVKDGGRMALSNPGTPRVGTWNIRWFPYGSPPNQPSRSAASTDLEWLACTLVWMQPDILMVQESLTTLKARQAWDRILTTLERDTGDSWRWAVQQCGKPDSHHVGVLWNASRVTLSGIQSLWPFNSKARSARNPCEGGLRPGHYARVHSKRSPGMDFHLIGLHLKSGPTVSAVEARHRALNRIDTTVARFLEEDRDVIILGDLNTIGAGDIHSRKSELKYIRRMVAKETPGFDDLVLEPRCSHYFRGRGGWLDHALVAKTMAAASTPSARVTGYCAVAGCRRITGDYPLAYRRLSDHCPVIIEIENPERD